MRFTVKCSICDHGRFLATWPSVGYRKWVVCPSCNGSGRVRIPYSLMTRVIYDWTPCEGEFGYRPDSRCNYCGTTFDEDSRECCPRCNTTNYQLNANFSHVLKARKRRTYTPDLFKLMGLDQPSFPIPTQGAA